MLKHGFNTTFSTNESRVGENPVRLRREAAVIIADIISGILFGALAGMGIGGGGLIVIYLTLLRNFTQIDAQGVNLLFFTVAASASMVIHLKKRKLQLFPLVIMTLTGLAGAYFGTRITAVIPQSLTRKLFGVMLVASGMITAVKTQSKAKENGVSKKDVDFRHM